MPNLTNILYFGESGLQEQIDAIKFLGVYANDTERDAVSAQIDEWLLVVASAEAAGKPAFYLKTGSGWVVIAVSSGTISVDLSGYYTKAQIDSTLAGYYTQSQIDTFNANFATVVYVTSALTSYYTKTEVDANNYNKTEVDALIAGANAYADSLLQTTTFGEDHTPGKTYVPGNTVYYYGLLIRCEIGVVSTNVGQEIEDSKWSIVGHMPPFHTIDSGTELHVMPKTFNTINTEIAIDGLVHVHTDSTLQAAGYELGTSGELIVDGTLDTI